MDRYCVIMFVTSEQETAIKNLFLQNDWVFHCKALPEDLTDSITPSLIPDLHINLDKFTFGGNKLISHKECNKVDMNYIEGIKNDKDLFMLEVLARIIKKIVRAASKKDDNDKNDDDTQSNIEQNSRPLGVDLTKSQVTDDSFSGTEEELEDEGSDSVAVIKNHDRNGLDNLNNGKTVEDGLEVIDPNNADSNVIINDCLNEMRKGNNETTSEQKANCTDRMTDSRKYKIQDVRSKALNLSSESYKSLGSISNHSSLINNADVGGLFSKKEKADSDGTCRSSHQNSYLVHQEMKVKSKKSKGTSKKVTDKIRTENLAAGTNNEEVELKKNSAHKKRRKKDTDTSLMVDKFVNNVQAEGNKKYSIPKKNRNRKRTLKDEADKYMNNESNKLTVNKQANSNKNEYRNSTHKGVSGEAIKIKKTEEKDKQQNNASTNSSMKENAIRNSFKHKRYCGTCGKEIIRKKICYDCELTCKYCGKSYANYKTRGRRCLLRTHLKSHEGDKSFICDTCGKGFSHIDYMKRHAKLVHVDLETSSFICHLCSKIFKNNHTLQIHLKSIHNSKDETFQCDTCGAVFKRKGSLSAHLRRVHVTANNYKCDECGLTVKTADSLRSHKRTAHTPRVRTVCYICGVLLLSQDKLKKHIMRHKNRRTFQCTKCSKKFYTSHEVRQHYRVHTGEKPFKCHLCMYACAVKGNLTKHMRKHKSGDCIPQHNYAGSDYSVKLARETNAEYIKLGNTNLDAEELDYSFEETGQDPVEQKDYDQAPTKQKGYEQKVYEQDPIEQKGFDQDPIRQKVYQCL